ncbi:MAG: PilZ domain-containing protein [Endomicrobiales bacterium]
MSREYRKNVRISCSVPVLLRFTSGEPTESWGIIYDISLGGIKLETRRLLRAGEPVFLSFGLGEAFLFENTRGTVIRVSGMEGYYMVGIKFDLVVDRNHLRDGLFSMIETEA